MIKFNVANINLCTETEGPYKRLTIWFQGCNICCRDCCNPDYQPHLPRHIMTLEELVGVIAKAKSDFDIEGVTYSGGEPTLQKGLPYLTEKIHMLGLGVIVFTGRKYEEVSDILKGCDIVLDGAYDRNLPETDRHLLGSKNQRILLLTDRYKDDTGWFYDNAYRKVEVNVGETIQINGDKI